MVSDRVPASSLGIPKLCMRKFCVKIKLPIKLKIISKFKAIYLTSICLMCMFSLIGNVLVSSLHHKDLRINENTPKWVIYF